jgi:iron-sulfur cluster assembly protein
MITFTEPAIAKVVSQLKKRGKGAGIRIGVKTTGCSGLAYVLEYVDEYVYEESVTNFSQKDFVVLVSQKHLPYVQGMVVDYVRNGLNEGFEFRNPNERDRCGCGESFRI